MFSIQCEAVGCGKWRRIPWWVDRADAVELGNFECAMMKNWGTMFRHVGCDYPEDSWDEAEVRSSIQNMATNWVGFELYFAGYVFRRIRF
jgi:hypothetical protein